MLSSKQASNSGEWLPTILALDQPRYKQNNECAADKESRVVNKQYPLSEKMMKPASNPTYYDVLLKELDAAPKRSWFKSVINRWKGSLRFS